MKSDRPLDIFIFAYFLHLFVTFLEIVVVSVIPQGDIQNFHLFLVILVALPGSIARNFKFVSICGFFNRIADVRIGGTYMTLLATILNFAGEWPSQIVFPSVDLFTFVDENKKEVLNGYYPVAITLLVMGLIFGVVVKNLMGKL